MSAAPASRDRSGPGAARAIPIIALTALFAYFNSLHGDYVLDDLAYIKEGVIERPLSSPLITRPLIAISLALNYKADGLNPRGFHAMNLAVHILAGFFLYDLIRRTLLLPRFAGRFERSAGWIGLAAALIWLVHPLNTQAVTYVIQRCESFMGMFLLAGLWCYVRGATEGPAKPWMAAAVVACTLGSACKEMMLALPLLALLYDRAFITGSWRESRRARWLTLGLLLVPPITGTVILAVRGLFTDSAGTVGFGVRIFTPYTYALTQSEVILHYLRLSVLPVGQALDYLDWTPRQSPAECWPALTAILALLAATAVGVWRNAAWSVPAAWFFINLAPTSSIIPLQDAVFEHRMYLPLAGVVSLVVCGIAAIALRRWPSSGPVLGVVAGVAVAALGLLCAARNEDYSSAARLLQDNAEKRPANGRVRLNLAIEKFAGGDAAGAEEQLTEASKLPLKVPALQQEYARVLRELGRTAEAVTVCEASCREYPDSVEAVYELGLSLLVDGRIAESVPHLKRAVDEKPQNHFFRLHYGIALKETGKAQAQDEFHTANELAPDYAQQLSRTSRRLALTADAKPPLLRLAVLYADATCRMTTPTAEMRDTLALCLARVGRYPEAAREEDAAAKLARDRGDAYLAGRIEARAALFRAGKSFLTELGAAR
jgi:tetratricopeptide (TPR) repeat protein